MVLVIYILGTASGFATPSHESHYEQQFKITVQETYTITLLNSAKVKGTVIYRGAIKKRALDTMEHLHDVTLQFDPGTSIDVIEEVLKSLALQNNSNVVVINCHITTIKRERIDGPKRDN
jgi:hypothetical protein